jgi:hypothetical protein
LHDVVSQRDYKERYYKSLMPLGLKYAEVTALPIRGHYLYYRYMCVHVRMSFSAKIYDMTEHRFHAAFTMGRKAYKRVPKIFLTNCDMD